MVDLSPELSRRNLVVALSQITEPGLEFDLIFQDGRLRRINVYIPHPSIIYWDNQDMRSLCSTQVEAGSNYYGC